MHADITRSTFRKGNHYRNVLKQQGRLGVEADFNEQGDITAYRTETAARDIIGLCGAPRHDAGFAITGKPGGNFEIGAGRMYVAGMLCENDASSPAVVFTTQPDYRPDPIRDSGRYLIYLDVWLWHRTALDDPGIREVALGGPDTATRTKVVWQVKALPVGPVIDCSTEPENWKSSTNPSDAKLSARAMPDEKSDQPCILPPGAGYRRLENQLYRVEIHRGGQAADSDPNKVATFKWSRDNGSVAARIQSIAGGAITLTAARTDSAVGFAPGQWIELLDDRNEWTRTAGVLAAILKVDGLTLTVDTTGAIEPQAGALTQFAAGLDQAFHPKVRRWDSAKTIDADVPANNDGFIDLEDGVQVKFASGACQTGDYWLIPARTDKNDVEWPRDGAAPPKPLFQLPHGIVHNFCRLSIVEVDTSGQVSVIEDCRRLFTPLTENNDECGCCTWTVGKTAAADYPSIQKAIDALPDAGGQVCVLPGNYTENVTIKGRKNIVLSGCGERSHLTGHRPYERQQAAPTILIEECLNIRVESLAFTVVAESAIAVHGSKQVTVRDCEMEMTADDSEPAIFMQVNDGVIERNVISGATRERERKWMDNASIARGGGGIQVAGGSSRVRVVDNLVSSINGQGITLGSLEDTDENGQNPILIRGRPKNPGDPCDGCHPVSTKVLAIYLLAGNGPKRKRRSPLSLKEIQIADNRILGTGLDGIGVAGFFDLNEADEFVTVRGLGILDNEIRGCLRIAPAPIEREMADAMGYGGIALADVSELVIRDNIIEDTGAAHGEPVCGIFVLHAQGIDISRNKILGNGRDGETRSQGRRGGIQVVYTLAPVAALPRPHQEPGEPEPTGFPALKVQDNIVGSPVGPALSVTALGPVSVLGNQLASGGVAARSPSSVFGPATVFIFNLGISNEVYFQQALFAGLGLRSVAPGPGLDDFRVGSRLANGNVLFAHNQCSLDLLEIGASHISTSLSLVSLDDVGFHDNQCDCNLRRREDFVVTHAFLSGGSVRVTANRLKEGLFQAAYSIVSAGRLNTTTHNQVTHCVRTSGALLHNESNTVLIDSISPKHCGPPLIEVMAKLKIVRNV